MKIQPIPGTLKRILISYKGGFRDGMDLDSGSANPEEAERARQQYFLSQGGKVGTRFQAYSDLGIQEMFANKIVETPEGPRLSWIPKHDMNHVYELTKRDEDDDTIWLTYTYMGLANPGG